MNKYLLPSFFLLLLSSNLLCQIDEEANTSKRYLVSMVKNTKEYVCEIERSTVDSIWIKVDHEILALPMEDVATIRIYNYNGRFDTHDRNTFRHVLAPSAYPIKQGEFHYQNLLIAGSAFHFGITDQFSITSATFIPTIIDEYLVGYIAPKASIKISPTAHIGLGVLAGFDIDLLDFDFYSAMIVPFINTTIGDEDRNLTLGLGYGVEDTDFDGRITAGMIGCRLRFLERMAFVSESTLAGLDSFNNKNFEIWYFGSHVFQLLRRKNTFDLGLVSLSLFGDRLVAIPYIGYARSF